MRIETTNAVAVFVVLAVCLQPAVARAAEAAPAAEAPPAAIDGAKEARGTGDRFFHLGRFDDAIAAYERAFSLDPQPAFLANIGLAHRRQYQIDGKIDHLLRARELYRNYLKLDPASRMRPGIEKILADLDARIAGDRPPPAVAPPPLGAGAVPPPAPRPPPAAPPPAAPAPPLAVAPLATAPPAPPARSSSRRAWFIAGGVAAAAAIAIVFVSVRASGSDFDGPRVDLTPR